MRLHRTACTLALMATSVFFLPGVHAEPAAGSSAGQPAGLPLGKSAERPAAQALEKAPTKAACPLNADMSDAQLLGEWTGTIEGLPQAVRLQLDTHPKWKGSVKGTIERAGARRPMVGDVADGEVTLEESADGQRITATWLGDVVEGSCAREIRGDYIEGEDAPRRPFVLRKVSP